MYMILSFHDRLSLFPLIECNKKFVQRGFIERGFTVVTMNWNQDCTGDAIE